MHIIPQGHASVSTLSKMVNHLRDTLSMKGRMQIGWSDPQTWGAPCFMPPTDGSCRAGKLLPALGFPPQRMKEPDVPEQNHTAKCNLWKLRTWKNYFDKVILTEGWPVPPDEVPPPACIAAWCLGLNGRAGVIASCDHQWPGPLQNQGIQPFCCHSTQTHLLWKEQDPSLAVYGTWPRSHFFRSHPRSKIFECSFESELTQEPSQAGQNLRSVSYKHDDSCFVFLLCVKRSSYKHVLVLYKYEYSNSGVKIMKGLLALCECCICKMIREKNITFFFSLQENLLIVLHSKLQCIINFSRLFLFRSPSALLSPYLRFYWKGARITGSSNVPNWLSVFMRSGSIFSSSSQRATVALCERTERLLQEESRASKSFSDSSDRRDKRAETNCKVCGWYIKFPTRSPVCDEVHSD